MTTQGALRGNIAGAAAAITFTACDVVAAAQAQVRSQARATARGTGGAKAGPRRLAAVPSGRRREVVVGGRRVKTIDVHAHCVIPEAYALLGLQASTTIAGPGSARSASGASARWTRRASTWRRSASTRQWYRAERDVVDPGDQDPERAARRVLRDVPRSLRRLRVGGPPVPGPGRAAARRRREEARARAAPPSGRASPTTSSPTRSFIRSGPRPRSSACSSSSIRRARRTSPGASRATAGWPTPSATRWTRPSRSRTSSSRARSIASRAQDLLGPRRRLSAVLRAALRQQPARRAGHGHRRQAEEEADGVSAADVLRHAGLHLRGAAAPGGGSRRRTSSSSAPTIRSRGRTSRSTTCSRRRASATRSGGRSSARPRRGSWGSSSSRPGDRETS